MEIHSKKRRYQHLNIIIQELKYRKKCVLLKFIINTVNIMEKQKNIIKSIHMFRFQISVEKSHHYIFYIV